ncbi:MAG: C40 family peptidase [Acidimicrobiales bacterium]|nr:C40 family peptidase [Acidimicrobiales bacterium]
MAKGMLAGAVVVAGLLALPVLAVVAATGQAGPGVAAAPSSGAASGAPSSGPAVPASWMAIEQEAAATCPGLPWSLLGAVGTIESHSGQSTAPGVWSGANGAGAEGPMQFEPATFAAYATVGPGGAQPPSPYDPVDAVFTAAAMLCANGGGAPETLRSAVLAYDHSAVYAEEVLTLTTALAADPMLSASAAAALTFAAGEIGVPYLWGGTGPGGFDCSGLVQAAYASAGVILPRVAQDQYDAGPPVPAGSAPEPGDLVFFGSGPAGIGHVGLVVALGIMIDAPDTGAFVRAETFPVAVGAPWGTDVVVGFTRPVD